MWYITKEYNFKFSKKFLVWFTYIVLYTNSVSNLFAHLSVKKLLIFIILFLSKFFNSIKLFIKLIHLHSTTFMN